MSTCEQGNTIGIGIGIGIEYKSINSFLRVTDKIIGFEKSNSNCI